MKGGAATSRGALRIALFCTLVPYLGLVDRFRFLTDDAYITFRYAKNVARGLGPVFNPGEAPPVEGYSNFLWVLICAAIESVGLDVAVWGNVLSSVCGALLVGAFLVVLVRRLDLPLVVALPATWVLALHPPFAVWSTGGLATMPFALLLFLGFERLLLRPGGIHVVSSAAVLLALSLVRVEGFLWAVALLILGALSRRARDQRIARELGLCAGILIAGVGTYLAWRWATYGALLPNTVVVKSGSSLSRLARGFDYVALNFLTCLDLWILVPATFVALRSGRRAIGIPATLLAWAFPVWSIAVSGDFMTFGRFLVPGWAFTCLIGAWLLADLAACCKTRLAAAMPLAAGTFIVTLGLLPAFDVHPVPETVRETFRFRFNRAPFRSELGQWEDQRANARMRANLGRALARFVPAGSSIVAGNVGAVGYHSDLFVHDLYGLVSPEVAAAESSFDAPGDASARSPGHDYRVEYDFFLEREPDVLEARLIEGLPGLAKNGEADARKRFTTQFEKQWTDKIEKAGLTERYVAEFRALDLQEAGFDRALLAWWQRVEAREADEARARVRRRLRAWEADTAFEEGG